MKQIEEEVYQIEEKDIKFLVPVRNKDSHKGVFGYIGILGGCLNYSGSIKLASQGLASLRSGAGVVRVIVPKSIAPFIAPYLLEQTLFTIEDRDSHMIYSPNQLDKALTNLKVLAIGMGWGEGKENPAILKHILECNTIPIVVDADGLNTLAKMDKQILKTTKCKVILTPHEWECKYHIVFAPKFRRKEIYGKLKQEIGMILRENSQT